MSARRAALPPRFDPLDRAVLADPYPAYAALRAAEPLCRGPAGTWVATRHADVAALLRDRRLGSELPVEHRELAVGRGAASAFMGRIVLYRDGAEHGRLRALLGHAFHAGVARAFAGRVRALVAELLEPLLARGRFELVAELALPLPLGVACELMGIPPVDRDAIRPRALALGRAFTTVLPTSARADADAAVEWLRRYLATLLDARASAPGDDLLSRMLALQRVDDRLTREAIVDNAVFAFFAGFETTTNLIANGVVALLEHPAQLARLRATPALVPRAVEELLRYDPPIQGVARLVREPLELGGRRLRRGRLLVLLLGSANRDERVFRAPDALDVAREPNPHVSFGGGVHHCLGATLARIELSELLGQLLAGSSRLELTGAPVRQRDTGFRAYAGVPLRAGPA